VLVAGAFADAVEAAIGACTLLKIDGSLILLTSGAEAFTMVSATGWTAAMEVFPSAAAAEALVLALILAKVGYCDAGKFSLLAAADALDMYCMFELSTWKLFEWKLVGTLMVAIIAVLISSPAHGLSVSGGGTRCVLLWKACDARRAEVSGLARGSLLNNEEIKPASSTL
jgi:hypothetical protein